MFNMRANFVLTFKLINVTSDLSKTVIKTNKQIKM